MLVLTLTASQADPTALGPAEQQLHPEHSRLFPCPYQRGELQDGDPRGPILQPVASSCLGSSRKNTLTAPRCLNSDEFFHSEQKGKQGGLRSVR